MRSRSDRSLLISLPNLNPSLSHFWLQMMRLEIWSLRAMIDFASKAEEQVSARSLASVSFATAPRLPIVLLSFLISFRCASLIIADLSRHFSSARRFLARCCCLFESVVGTGGSINRNIDEQGQIQSSVIQSEMINRQRTRNSRSKSDGPIRNQKQCDSFEFPDLKEKYRAEQASLCRTNGICQRTKESQFQAEHKNG